MLTSITEEEHKRAEEKGRKIGYWAVKVGRSIFEIVIAFILVSLEDKTGKQLSQSFEGYEKQSATVEYRLLTYESWILNIVFVLPILRLCVMACIGLTTTAGA